MSANDRRSIAPIVELAAPLPIFVDGLGAMTVVGAVTHLVFTALQQVDGRMSRVVQARLIVPTDQLQAIGRAILAGHIEATCATDEVGEPVKLQ